MTRIVRISGMNQNRVSGVFCGKQCRCKNHCNVNYKGEKIPLSKCKNWCKAVKPNTDKLPSNAHELFRGTISNSSGNSTNTVVSNNTGNTGTTATSSTSLATLTEGGSTSNTTPPAKDNSKLLIGGALVGAAALLYYFTS